MVELKESKRVPGIGLKEVDEKAFKGIMDRVYTGKFVEIPDAITGFPMQLRVYHPETLSDIKRKISFKNSEYVIKTDGICEGEAVKETNPMPCQRTALRLMAEMAAQERKVKEEKTREESKKKDNEKGIIDVMAKLEGI